MRVRNLKKKQQDCSYFGQKLINSLPQMQDQAISFFKQGQLEDSFKIWQEIINFANQGQFKGAITNPEFYANAFFMRSQCLNKLNQDSKLMMEGYRRAYQLDSTRLDALEQLMDVTINLNYQREVKSLILSKYQSLAHQPLDLEHKSLLKIFASQILDEKELGRLPTELLAETATDHPLAAIMLMESEIIKEDFLAVKIYMDHLNKYIFNHIKYLLRFMQSQTEYYRNPKNPMRDFVKAMDLLKFIVKKANAPMSCHILAEFYDGLFPAPDIKRNPAEAIKYYEKAASVIPESAHNLGYKYAYGEDVEQDATKANEYYRLAIKQSFIPTYIEYAFLLLKTDYTQNLETILALLESAPNSPMIKFFYFQLKLFEVQLTENNKTVNITNVIRQGAVTNQEARKIYQGTQELLKENQLDSMKIHMFSGLILQYWLEDVEMAIDHYRFAAECGSKEAHDKLFHFYTHKISTAISEETRKWYIASLTNVAETRELFFDIPPPLWLTPKFNAEKFQLEYKMSDEKSEATTLCQLERAVFCADNFESLTDQLFQLTYVVQAGALSTNQLGHYASKMGAIASNIIKKSGAQEIRFLYQQLLILLSTIKDKYQNTEFSNWSLMRLLGCVGQFRLHSKNPVFSNLMQHLFTLINNRFPMMTLWKLVMLIEYAAKISYQQQGVKKFIKNLVFYTLEQWQKTPYTESDGDIRLGFNLARLNHHYHFKLELRKTIKLLINRIVQVDFNYYKNRRSVAYNCCFTLLYFKNVYQKLDNKNQLLSKISTDLLSRSFQTTSTWFQREVEKFCVTHFSSKSLNGFNCIEATPEKRSDKIVSPVDLVMHYAKHNKYIGIGHEADGCLHFFYNGTKAETPSYDLKTKFSNHIATQQGLNMIRTPYFLWQNQSDLERYQTMQKKLANVGLLFPESPPETKKNSSPSFLNRSLENPNWRVKKSSQKSQIFANFV